MSFSKAKIQRFNDVKITTACSAPLKTKTLLKGASENTSDKSSETASVKCIPFFKQPNTINKKPSVNCGKTKLQTYSKENIELEALKEKIVECENKDASIKDLSDQLDEIKEKIILLENANLKLVSEIARYEEAVGMLNVQHAGFVENLTATFQQNLSVIRLKEGKLKQDIEILKNESKILKETNQRDLLDLKNDINKYGVLTTNLIEDCNLAIMRKCQELQQKEEELKALELNCIEMQKVHSLEIDRLQKEHQLEIQDIEFEMLQTMTELHKERENVADKIKGIEEKMAWELKRTNEIFEKEKKIILLESEEKVKEIENKYSHIDELSESKWQEKINEIELGWKNKLIAQTKESDTILRECQAISEYNIIQSEVEKNKVQTELDTKTEELFSLKEKYTANLKNFDNLNAKYKKLQIDMSNIILELNDTRKNLAEQLSKQEAEIALLSKEKLKYEITIKNSQITVDVLKKRLINSDKDVEQLKQELESCEEKLMKYEQTCIDLALELKQSQNFNDELEMQYDSTIKFNRTEIEQLKNDLVNKVDSYKVEVEKLNKKYEVEEKIKKEIMNQLHEAHQVISKLKSVIENLEPANTQYKFEVEQSQNELDDYRMREMDWNIVKEKYEGIIKDLEKNLEMRMEEIAELKRQLELVKQQNQDQFVSIASEGQEDICKKYIQISGKCDELLEAYEKLENDNFHKLQKIAELTNALQDNSNIEEKYYRQKKDYEQLLEKMKGYENQNNNKENISLKRTIEKLEKEKNLLNNKVGHLEDDLKDISQKYTHLIGHQNNKQKIKHMEDLKTKNSELKQSNTELDNKLRSYTKTIEKLKKENSDLKKRLKKNKFAIEDKENICSPNRSLNSSRVDSPFRDRN